jgi:hypothetical protein
MVKADRAHNNVISPDEIQGKLRPASGHGFRRINTDYWMLVRGSALTANFAV